MCLVDVVAGCAVRVMICVIGVLEVCVVLCTVVAGLRVYRYRGL